MGDSFGKNGDQPSGADVSSDKADAVGQAELASAGVASRPQPPAFLANMTDEERIQLEMKLKRKIDLRLLPSIIIMYILNYIDR